MIDWYEEEDTPDPAIWWWAVEHLGHPAYYVRALMPGDFAPGRPGPLSRHVLALDGSRPDEDPVPCGTCELVPNPADLEPIERTTGNRGYLQEFRSGRTPWRTPTDPASCWLCNTHKRATTRRVALADGAEVSVCDGCASEAASGRY